MSKTNLKRIKQIRQKTENQQFNPIPLGVDGLLVDMMSNLDLEEDLKLGNNHFVQIDEVPQGTIITQYYLSVPRNNKTLEELTAYVTHTVVTQMLEVAFNYLVNNKTQNNAFITDGDSQDSIIVQAGQNTSSLTKIKTTLYEGYGIAHPLHSKIILIQGYTDEYGLIDYKVDEQVDSTLPFDTLEEIPFNISGEGD